MSRPWSVASVLLASLASVSAAACVDEEDGAVAAAEGTPTWYADVEPIVAKSCAGCHQPGSYASFLPLTSYEEVSGVKELVAAAMSDGSMPPWTAASDCTTYEGDISVDEDAVQTVVDWAEAGAPEGDPATSPGGLESGVPMGGLSRIDHTLEMTAAYLPEAEPDDYRCFLFDWPAGSTYLTGYEVDIGNKDVVHHVVVYVSPPGLAESYRSLDEADEGEGYSCFGGPGIVDNDQADWLGGWAPGGISGDFPEGTGIHVEEDSVVIVQMHYNVENAGPQPDQSSIRVMVDDAVDHPGQIQPWANPAWLSSTLMELPAQTEDISHGFSFAPGGDYLLWTSNLHMHELGKNARLAIDRADGSEDCMLQIDDWDFSWQRSYRFEEPKLIEDGDAISLECTWDNPTDEDIYWGDGTGDEMCLGTFLITLP